MQKELTRKTGPVSLSITDRLLDNEVLLRQRQLTVPLAKGVPLEKSGSNRPMYCTLLLARFGSALSCERLVPKSHAHTTQTNEMGSLISHRPR